jgi:cellulose synthase (UDP-forming)
MIEDYNSNRVIKVISPKKQDVWCVRFLISCGLLSMAFFIYWFADPEHIGYAPLYYFLTFALAFKLLKMVHEWYHYWSLSVPKRPESTRKWTVDVLTTACPGEPTSMIIDTLRAMVRIKYPHTTYLCDEGNDPILKNACQELGVVHVTRTEKKDAKAGNINNALQYATGEICVILDPDHEPVPEFLDRVLPYFEDEKIGYVQCVQAYKNQTESFVARGAAEQTYHFYGPMMMCMNTYGTVQVIGANCTFRRSALDSIGGHAAGLAEDMHTAMQLNAKGWKSVYVPEILTRGLVPATLSAYYKQQLKWSRGAFELLFRTYPGLFKKLNWRQKIHYMTIPLYFLFGLINFIDILVPLLALCLAETPWNFNVVHFSLFFFPLFGISLLIRLYTQQWLLEKSERGLHLSGGILRTAGWWILLIGFLYAIANIKVPYIPTPKEDEHKNHWALCIPNFIIISVWVLCTWYGLSRDWTPYSLAMAFYGFMVSCMLVYATVMSQQAALFHLKKILGSSSLFTKIRSASQKLSIKTGELITAVFKKKPIALAVGLALVCLNYSNIGNEIKNPQGRTEKETGGFYFGVNADGRKPGFDINSTNVIVIKETWKSTGPDSLGILLQRSGSGGAVPMLSWEPAQLYTENFWKEVTKGSFDPYLERCAAVFRAYKEPVFLIFAPGFDDTSRYFQNPDQQASKQFQLCWQHIYTFFNNLGVSNLTWIWSPRYSSALDYFPGPKFVDWIGVSCLNYSERKEDKNWFSFKELYAPYRKELGKLQKPFMVTELGSLKGPDQLAWIKEAAENIHKDFKEVRSAIVFAGKKEFLLKNTIPSQNLYSMDFSFSNDQVATLLNEKDLFHEKPYPKNAGDYLLVKKEKYNSAFIKGSPGHFSLVVGNKNWYIRGVSFNTEHDWRDGNMPLTRKQLEKDFLRIREMGANVIRRYDHGIYDRNILNIASEYDLKVLYGFWFDPKVDYYTDSIRVKQYIREVEEKVLRYKDHPSVLAWSLGNETWGLLKHSFSKPYLVKVRGQYVKLVEYLAQRIHELDPAHPVFSCMEHETYQLPGELAAFHDGAPSIDVIGINSYYEEQISTLNHHCWEFDSLRPYLISEFGPRGYWDPAYNKTEKGLLIEDSENEKAEWYRKQWTKYVAGFKGYNIGGFAYCWHDRMEGSNTWFGLTDYKGRNKPSYYALKELWTGTNDSAMGEFRISCSSLPGPGKSCVFKAVPKSMAAEEYTYEWSLNKNDYLDEVNGIEYLDDGKSVNVKFPEVPLNYRLYLYVSDKKGNVYTASLPVKINKQ